MQPSVIQACALTKSFTQGKTTLTVFAGLDYTFEQPNTYALMGVSGAGKSTLLHILAGIEQPTQGSVVFNGKALSSFTIQEHEKLLNRSFGLLFQSPYLIHELSVIENIMIPGLIGGMSYEQAQQQAAELLHKIQLYDKAHLSPSCLSGGQQQRVAIMRALFNKPSFLFADEPTGNLDEKMGKDIVTFLQECQKEWHMGLIISTHDKQIAHSMQQVLTLHDGRLIQI